MKNTSKMYYESLVTRVFSEKIVSIWDELDLTSIPKLEIESNSDKPMSYINQTVNIETKEFGHPQVVTGQSTDSTIHINVTKLRMFCSLIKFITHSDEAVYDAIHMVLNQECRRIWQVENKFRVKYNLVYLPTVTEWNSLEKDVNAYLLSKCVKGNNRALARFFITGKELLKKDNVTFKELMDFRETRLDLAETYNPKWSRFYKVFF